MYTTATANGTSPLAPEPAGNTRGLSRRTSLVLGAGLLAAGVASAAVAVPAMAARPMPSAGMMSNAQTIAMTDSPAVQLVNVTDHATVYTAQPVVDSTKLVRFANTNPTVKAAWEHRHFALASREVVAQFLAHPGDYLSAGHRVTVHPVDGGQGSAWDVSSNGYLVTNNHVVAMPSTSKWLQDAAGEQLTGPAMYQQFATSITQQLRHGLYWGGTLAMAVTASEQSDVATLADNWIGVASTVASERRDIQVGGGQNVRVSNPGMRAQVVKASPSTWPNPDVAILKVNATDLPVIPLGDDTTLQTGDPVYALGYPADASFDSGTSQTATVTATMTNGQVTNRLSSHGMSAIENSATINHGSSGGALVDSDGNVVGITTALDSSTEAQDGDNGGKLFYAVPISVVKQYLRAAGVTQLVAPDQATYNEAMTLMQGSHYVAALTDLHKVETDGYSTPYIMMHTSMVQAAISHGESKPLPRAGFTGTAIALLVAALLFLAAGGWFLANGLRKRNNGKPGAPAQTATPPQSPTQTGSPTSTELPTQSPAAEPEWLPAPI